MEGSTPQLILITMIMLWKEHNKQSQAKERSRRQGGPQGEKRKPLRQKLSLQLTSLATRKLIGERWRP